LVVGRAGAAGPSTFNSVEGQRYPIAPPIGSQVIAWLGTIGVEAWLDRFGGHLTDVEREDYRAAVAAARGRGYAVSLRVQPLEELQRVYDEGNLHTPAGRRQLSDAMSALAHEDHLPWGDELPADAELFAITAPIFGPDRTLLLAISLKPSDTYRGRDIPRLAGAVVRAAQRVMAAVDGREPIPWSPTPAVASETPSPSRQPPAPRTSAASR
jgi:DNA-binding IclR family transcriptional regulator